MAGYWPCFLFVFIDLNFISVHKKAKRELGQFSVILTSCLVSNIYTLWRWNHKRVMLLKEIIIFVQQLMYQINFSIRQLNFILIVLYLRTGIKSIINLQHPGEHASCGFGLEPESGFSYIPEDFMQEDSM